MAAARPGDDYREEDLQAVPRTAGLQVWTRPEGPAKGLRDRQTSLGTRLGMARSLPWAFSKALGSHFWHKWCQKWHFTAFWPSFGQNVVKWPKGLA